MCLYYLALVERLENWKTYKHIVNEVCIIFEVQFISDGLNGGAAYTQKSQLLWLRGSFCTSSVFDWVQSNGGLFL